MPSHAIHNSSYRATSHVGNADVLANKRETAAILRKYHFTHVDLYGPTKNMNPKHRARVIAARKETGLL